MTGPHTLQGGLIRVTGDGGVRQVLTFQFNPDRITRTLRPNGRRGQPSESLSFELVFDASDGLALGDPRVADHGIAPQLAALTRMLEDNRETGSRWLDRLVPGAPDVLTVFVWGVGRAAPVRVETLTIEERLFDGRLNPLHAVAMIELRVMQAPELAGHRYGRELLHAYLTARRDLADSFGFRSG